jgi:hypothetical protein
MDRVLGRRLFADVMERDVYEDAEGRRNRSRAEGDKRTGMDQEGERRRRANLAATGGSGCCLPFRQDPATRGMTYSMFRTI